MDKHYFIRKLYIPLLGLFIFASCNEKDPLPVGEDMVIECDNSKSLTTSYNRQISVLQKVVNSELLIVGYSVISDNTIVLDLSNKSTLEINKEYSVNDKLPLFSIDANNNWIYSLGGNVYELKDVKGNHAVALGDTKVTPQLSLRTNGWNVSFDGNTWNLLEGQQDATFDNLSPEDFSLSVSGSIDDVHGYLNLLFHGNENVVKVRLAITENTVEVRTVDELYEAVGNAGTGDIISIIDGVYRDVKLVASNSGIEERPIVIKAKNPGKVTFSGDVKVELRGDYVNLSGICFKNGARKQSEWTTHSPGIVAVYADHCEISHCLFDNFDNVNSAYVTTSLDEEGRVPQHCHIHHCAFVGKTTLDQVINLNNTLEKTDVGEPGIPMYHRVNNCYFSNPPKASHNGGGAIRIGYWRKDYGRCLIDHNLFERQDSEPEIVTSKSMENVMYANTVINCQGTMNFRHGDHQVALNNIFLGTDEAYGYGGMFVWGSNHIIANNYFELPKTLKSRGNAAIYFNSGITGGEHALAFDVAVLNNIFKNIGGSVFDLAGLYQSRVDTYGKDKVELPYNIRFDNNKVVGTEKTQNIVKVDYDGETLMNLDNQSWIGNVYENVSDANLIDNTGWIENGKMKQMSVDEIANLLPYRNIEGIELDFAEIISKPLDMTPLTKSDVGPDWWNK